MVQMRVRTAQTTRGLVVSRRRAGPTEGIWGHTGAYCSPLAPLRSSCAPCDLQLRHIVIIPVPTCVYSGVGMYAIISLTPYPYLLPTRDLPLLVVSMYVMV
jgi:hypothetical protein